MGKSGRSAMNVNGEYTSTDKTAQHVRESREGGGEKAASQFT